MFVNAICFLNYGRESTMSITQPTHDVRTMLLRRRFSVLTSLQRRSNVMCWLVNKWLFRTEIPYLSSMFLIIVEVILDLATKIKQGNLTGNGRRTDVYMFIG